MGVAAAAAAEKTRVPATVINVQDVKAPAPASPSPPKAGLHPAIFIMLWIALSSLVIVFNKFVLADADFPFPIFLTMLHMLFATAATLILAATTRLLDARHAVEMDLRTYCTTILPIGVLFSLSLMTSNQAYLYLSVSFIQMLKAVTPVTVLIATCVMMVKPIELHTFVKVSVIVLGTMIASYGEIEFVTIGVLYQIAGIIFESIRLALVQILLTRHKMDPLTSLFYFAPMCAVMNCIIAVHFEPDAFSVAAWMKPGLGLLLANAFSAFALNLSAVCLIGRTSSLALCLSGILKNILLVFLSILIWASPVTGLQYFGYGLSSVGLVVYQLGVPSLDDIANEARNVFAHCRRQMVPIFVAAVVMILVVQVAIVSVSGGLDDVSGIL